MNDSRRSPGNQEFWFTRKTDDGTSNFSHQRGRGILEKLIQQDPGNLECLERADVYLKDDPSYTRAMHATALSLRTGKINVFISYRLASDSDAAIEIADVLRRYSNDRIQVTLADEFTAKISGQDYREEIQRAIAKAQWFIILLSDPKQISEWSMYETGMFRAGMVSKRMNRLICIHHPEARLPDQIYEYQSVPATPIQLGHFLEGLLCRPDPLPGWEALRADIDTETIRALATRIAEAFKAPSKPVAFNHWVRLQVKRPDMRGDWHELMECPIETDSRTPDLFGKIEAPKTWGALVENVVQNGNAGRWLEELHAVIVKAIQGNVFRPISGTFECGHGGRVMRPILHSMEHDGTGEVYYFNVYFVDEISSAPTRAMPARLRTLLTALRMSDRIRWEVLERFRDVEWNDEQVAICATTFSRIEREGLTFGEWDLEELCANYGEAARDDIRRIVTRWRALKGYRSGNGSPQPGDLDAAFLAGDNERVGPLLVECRTLINEFLLLTYPVLESITIASDR